MTTRHPSRHRLTLLAAAAAPALLVLAGCSTTPEADAPDAAAVTAQPDEAAASVQESATNQPRLVATYDGGLLVVDALTLEVLADIQLDGFNRLAPAGDGRHVLVSHTATEAGWHVLDAGAWTQAHGDHAHHYVGEPHLTGTVIPAETPAHVVPHAGLTTLFDDGTGQITVIDTAALTDHEHGEHEEGAHAEGEHEEASAPLVVGRAESEAAHHGVAVTLTDGGMVATLGTEDSRPGIRVLDAAGTELTRSEDCPGVHGEGVAAGETVAIGCEDGVLLVRDGVVTKLSSPTPFGRIGNLYVDENLTIAAGDYKPDPDQGLTLTQVALIDTAAATLQVADVPGGAGFTWRGVGRGTDGEVVVLGTDGALHVLDQATGAPIAAWPIIDPWTAPEEWQTAHPAVVVLEGTAYVTDPATRSVHAVDVLTGEIWATAVLPHATNEVVSVTG